MAEEIIVPSRSDPKQGYSVYGQSRADQIRGMQPGFSYQWFSTDPKHPQYVGNRLKPHEIGNPATGYLMVEPWEVVEAKDVDQGRKRADQGKGSDSSVRNGSLIFCRTTEHERGKYDHINEKMCALQMQPLTDGEKGNAGGAPISTKVSLGNSVDTAAEAVSLIKGK